MTERVMISYLANRGEFMLYIIAVIMGISAGLLTKGNISGLLNLRFEKTWLIICAFLIQIAAQLAASKGVEAVVRYSLEIQGCSYGMLLAGLWFNRKYFGILTIAAGCLLNATVIMLNGGKMPVSVEILKKLNLNQAVDMLKAGADGKHTVITGQTRLAMLADIISPPGFWGLMMKIISIGDIFILVGLFVIVFEAVSGFRLAMDKGRVRFERYNA